MIFMGDWAGLIFFIVLVIGAVVGLKALSKQKTRTAEEFERNVAEGPTALGGTMNALQEMLNPEEAKAKEVVMQMKERRPEKEAGRDKEN